MAVGTLIKEAHGRMAAYMLKPGNRLYAILILIFMVGNVLQAMNRAALLDASDLRGYLEACIAAKYLDQDVFITFPNNSFSAFFYVVMSLLTPFAHWFYALLWSLANIAFYLWTMVVMNEIILKTQPGRKEVNVFLAPVLTAVLLATNIHMGQSNNIILLCSVLSMYYLYRQKPFQSALSLAFAIAYKTTPLFLVYFLLLKRKFRTAILTGLFSLVFLILVPMAFYTPAKSIDYFKSWSEIVIEPFFSGERIKTTNIGYYHTNQSLDAFLNRHFTSYGIERYGRAHHIIDKPVWDEGKANKVGVIIKLLIIALLGIVSGRSGKIHQRAFPFEFSLFLMAILFISPSSWPSHYILALPAVMLAVNEIMILPKGHWGRHLLGWSTGIFSGLMAVAWSPYLQSFSLYFIGLSIFFLAMTIYTLGHASRAGKHEGSELRGRWLARSGPTLKRS